MKTPQRLVYKHFAAIEIACDAIGLEGLLSHVRQLDPQKPSELANKLVTQIRNEDADNLTTEDATVLLCRATDTRVAWQDNLLAPFRLLRAVADETRIE